MAIIKRLEMKSIGQDVEKREPPPTKGGNV